MVLESSGVNVDLKACGSREKCTWLGTALFLLTIFLCWALQVEKTDREHQLHMRRLHAAVLYKIN